MVQAHLYLISFLVGTLWSIIAGIFSPFLDEPTGEREDSGDVAPERGSDVAPPEPGRLASLLPMTIAAFLALFGLVGIICLDILHTSFATSLVLAIPVALASTTAIFFFLKATHSDYVRQFKSHDNE